MSLTGKSNVTQNFIKNPFVGILLGEILCVES